MGWVILFAIGVVFWFLTCWDYAKSEWRRYRRRPKTFDPWFAILFGWLLIVQFTLNVQGLIWAIEKAP